MKYSKKKFLISALIAVLNVGTIGCSSIDSMSDNTQEIEVFDDTIQLSDDWVESECSESSEVVLEETFPEPNEQIEEENLGDIEIELEKQKNHIVSVPVVVATDDVNIRDNYENGNRIGALPEDSELKLLEHIDGWYKVQYYDQIGYISDEYATEKSVYDIDSSITKVLYAKEDTKLTIPYYLNISGNDEEVDINKLECFEVYAEMDDYYLVQTNEYIGYVAKDSVEELPETCVVVDISDQFLRLYQNNEVAMEVPVTTGLPTPSRASDEGVFEIYDITYNRRLITSGNPYVDVMMKYNGGEGFHDATHHEHEDGFKHGWKDEADIGGNTYLTNGSHGCINMRNKNALQLSEYVGLGTKVLIKK